MLNPATMDHESNKRIHIAFLPIPGAGHLIPMVEISRYLLHHNPSLFFTFLLIPASAADSATIPSALTELPATSFDVVHLPPPSFPPCSDPAGAIFAKLFLSINHSLPALRQTLQEMPTRGVHVSALIADMFATDIIPVASELGIKSYAFMSSSALMLSVFLHYPKTYGNESGDEWVVDRPLEFPGCPVFRVKDLPPPLHDWSKDYYKWFVDHCKRFELADGIILNSFHALEEEPIVVLTDPAGMRKPPVYVVGPLVRPSLKNDDNVDPSGCLRWLDEQPPESVLFVCFGGGGTLSTKQVTELAWGIELSGQRFLWVVRSPNDSTAFAAYLSLDEKDDPLGFLPKGFVERTKGRGFLVRSWAPQSQILSRGSTGGFMTHCGWNSVLESTINGVGFVACPLYAEQRMNAIELAEKVKVALRVKEDEEGVWGRDEIAKVVKELMIGEEGVKIKARMKILKDEAKRTMEKDGMSNVSLSKLAQFT